MGARKIGPAALLSAMALIAACGGTSDGDDASPASTDTVAPSGTSADTTDTPSSDFEVLDPADLAGLGPDDLEPISIRHEPVEDAPDDIGAITDRSARLVEQFGAEGAFDALAYAVTRGYSGDTIAAAIDRDDLQADGTITDVVPTLDSGDLLIAPSPAAGFASGPQRKRDGTPVAIEDLRHSARVLRAVADSTMEAWDAPETATAEGVAVLNLVQALANAGLSGDQIINAIVLGYGGMERRVAQVGMGPATVCRMVVIGGRVEPIANRSGCERYVAADRVLRAIYAEHGVEYPPCSTTSIEGLYDACSESSSTAATSTSTAPTPATAELPSTWEGPITFDPVAGDLVDSFVAIDRDGDGRFILNAFVEFTRESYDCSWTEMQTAEGTGELASDGSTIHFEGTFTSDIESSGDDCASGSETVATTYDVAIDDRTLSGSIFPYTQFVLTP